MITGSAVFAVLFLGGWDLLPFVSVPGFRPQDHGVLAMLLKMGVMAVKVAFFIFLFMWVRWTLPRFRFDQLMRLAWKGLIPISLGVFAVAIIGLHFGWHDSLVFNLAGNALVVAVAIPIAAASKVPISGRQANMPPTFARTDAVT
jgi:NADH-quinone oxidoreductase subunit H